MLSNKLLEGDARKPARASAAALCRKTMKITVSAMWLSESSGSVGEVPFASPQRAASAASSSQLSDYVVALFDSCHVISPATVVDDGARLGVARPSPTVASEALCETPR